QPLTGAVFDILVEVFQETLVERGLIGHKTSDLARLVENRPDVAPDVQPLFDEAYPGRFEEFRVALVDARDYLGFVLARTVERLSPNHLSYVVVANAMLQADRELTGGRYRRAMLESFDWRGIGKVRVGPRLSPPDKHSHTHSARTLLPHMIDPLTNLSFRER